jgi:hypothetical protein
MDRNTLQAAIKTTQDTIKAGLAWDKANGHNVYGFSSQCKNDKAQLRVFKKKLAAMTETAAPVRMGFAGIGSMA